MPNKWNKILTIICEYKLFKLIYKIKNKNCILLKFCFIQILVRKYFIRNLNIMFSLPLYTQLGFFLNSKFSLSFFFLAWNRIFKIHITLFKCLLQVSRKKPVLFGIITYFRNLKKQVSVPLFIWKNNFEWNFSRNFKKKPLLNDI